MIPYYRWIGLPHGLGADPDDGVAADCLVLTCKILRDQGFDPPAINPQWFDQAAVGAWDGLYREWMTYLKPACTHHTGTLILYYRPTAYLGMGVYIDQGYLTVSHKGGVVWKPLASVRARPWRLRNAAV